MLEKQHAHEAGKSLATFQTCVSAPKTSGTTRHYGGKKYTKGKLHCRSLLQVKIYMDNLCVLQEPLTFSFHAEPANFKLRNSTLPASLGISYLLK